MHCLALGLRESQNAFDKLDKLSNVVFGQALLLATAQFCTFHKRTVPLHIHFRQNVTTKVCRTKKAKACFVGLKGPWTALLT